MIVRKKDRVIVLGITGKQGTFWTEKMTAYGTSVVAGVNPKRAGENHVGVPIFATTADAVAKTGGDIAVMFIPPPMAKEAAVAAAQAGIRLLVVLTEHIPAQDVMAMHAAATRHGTRIVGPNTAGLVTPGECFVGIMPAFVPSVFKAGRVGVISRSGSLGTLVCLNLTRAGIGQSAFIGIGGDPMLGTTTRDALEALDRDSRTDAVVIVGEIGGAMEEDAATYAKTMRKPLVAFIAGAAAPPGKKMGHAGAIVTGNAGSHASKRRALEAAGVTVVDTPAQIAAAVAAGLRAGRAGSKVAASQQESA
jgi:succinyl-CoA synthetase alpha subunit